MNADQVEADAQNVFTCEKGLFFLTFVSYIHVHII